MYVTSHNVSPRFEVFEILNFVHSELATIIHSKKTKPTCST